MPGRMSTTAKKAVDSIRRNKLRSIAGLVITYFVWLASLLGLAGR